MHLKATILAFVKLILKFKQEGPKGPRSLT